LNITNVKVETDTNKVTIWDTVNGTINTSALGLDTNQEITFKGRIYGTRGCENNESFNVFLMNHPLTEKDLNNKRSFWINKNHLNIKKRNLWTEEDKRNEFLDYRQMLNGTQEVDKQIFTKIKTIINNYNQNSFKNYKASNIQPYTIPITKPEIHKYDNLLIETSDKQTYQVQSVDRIGPFFHFLDTHNDMNLKLHKDSFKPIARKPTREIRKPFGFEQHQQTGTEYLLANAVQMRLFDM